MQGMIDMHCHILPALDDGAKDLEETLLMAKAALKDGTGTIIATPHYWYGNYESSFNEVSKKVKEINSVLKEGHIDITLLPGQEVFFDTHTLKLYKDGVIGGLNGSRYLLLELLMDRMPEGLFECIYELQLLGAEVIIAHPERYIYIVNTPSAINRFIEEGCLFQLNGASLTGALGSSVRKTAKLLMEHGICDFIASDAHNTLRRPPGLSGTFDHVDEALKSMLLDNCKRLIMNEKIKKNREKIGNKSFFSFLSKKSFLKQK